MRQDVGSLRAFHASPLGAVTREAVTASVAQAWGDARGLDVLLWGYATPYAAPLRTAARLLAASPAGAGVEPWPAFARNRAALALEAALPFPNAFFDRLLAAHLLEESDAPAAALTEAARVLRPGGRMLVVAAARAGVWSRAEHTPFGHGRPWSRGQLERAMRSAGLEPVACVRALFVPPHPWLSSAARPWERVGARLWPALGGVLVMEAVKAPAPARAAPSTPAAARLRLRPAMRPAAVPAASASGRDDGGGRSD